MNVNQTNRIMRNIATQQAAIATALASEWIVSPAPSRAFFAVYPDASAYAEDTAMRVGVIVQHKGFSTFDCAIIQEADEPLQLKSFIVNTLVAAVFLGVYRFDEPVVWQLSL